MMEGNKYTITDVYNFISRGLPDILEYAIETCPSLIDQKDRCAYSVLHMVAVHPSVRILDYLLSKGAGKYFDYKAKTPWGTKTPIELAGEGEFSDIMKARAKVYAEANPAPRP